MEVSTTVSSITVIPCHYMLARPNHILQLQIIARWLRMESNEVLLLPICSLIFFLMLAIVEHLVLPKIPNVSIMSFLYNFHQAVRPLHDFPPMFVAFLVPVLPQVMQDLTRGTFLDGEQPGICLLYRIARDFPQPGKRKCIAYHIKKGQSLECNELHCPLCSALRQVVQDAVKSPQ